MSFSRAYTRRVPFCSQCGTENPDVARFCFACGAALVTAPPAPPPQEMRKVVSIVFSDLKGSTAMGEKLDSESLREVMTHYFDAMSAELERHGGVVEKYIGDAIMAVFGLPTLHEDDALRAVRAAAGMQAALVGVNDELERRWGIRLTVRTGVNTGQVVAGDPTTGQRLVVGDAVNVAARLEQAAGAQEILLGDLTYRLVRDYVDVEEVEPLELKGKSERVPAYRLVRVRDDADRPRRLDAPLVGRDQELELLRAQVRDAVDGRVCRLATVVGEAGVGKSRLLDELVSGLGEGFRILRGRCLPYGDGITFWPLAEAVRDVAQIAERDSTEQALEKLAGLTSDTDVTERVASAIGLSATPFPVEELVWGARRLLENLGREQPVLVLFDDIHWAEPTFLELIEQVVEHATDSRLVVICTARHEFVERNPSFSTQGGAVRIVLERLSEADAATVAEHLLGMTELDQGIRDRIVAAAEGNPLFIEQLLSMLIDDGAIVFEDGAWRAAAAIGDVAVPPTIHALLAARLDALGSEERAVIEPASVIGQLFVHDAVHHLAPEYVRAELHSHLGRLTDKQLIQPDHSRPDEHAFRFHHILIRDTAYDGILKRARATYHEQFVEWADGVNREGATEYEEILGYHLEQAYRYLSELGPLDDHGRALGADGSKRLAAAGHRAFVRGDLAASANLLGRATAMLPDDDPGRTELLPEYGEALLQTGDFTRAAQVLDEAIERAQAGEHARLRAHASLIRLLVELRASATWRDDAASTIAEAMAIFEESGDHSGLAKGWRLLAWRHGTSLQFGKSAEAFERAVEEARQGNDTKQLAQATTGYAEAAVLGPTAVDEAVARCEQFVQTLAGDRYSEAVVLGMLGTLYALQGSFDDARMHSARSLGMFEELGLDLPYAGMCIEAWRIEMLAGDVVAGERVLRRALERLQKLGETYVLATVSGLLGQTLYILGRYDEAESLGRMSKDLASDDDIDAQTLWRCLIGKVLAAQGSVDEGETLVREAIELLRPTDAILFQGHALVDLAEVQRRRGGDGVEATLLEARTFAEAKGSPVTIAAIDRMLAEHAADRSLA